LFVGFNDYATTGSGLKSLRGSHNDARDIYETLIKYGAFGTGSVLLIDDAVGTRLAAAAGGWKTLVLAQLQDVFARLSKEDLGCFFFAGHGTRVFEDSSRRWRSALVLPGVEARRVSGPEYLLIDELNDALRRNQVGSSLRVYDCCHAGQDELRSGLSDPKPIEGWLEAHLGLGDGHYALAGCRQDEVARERNERGIMSQALGVALRGGTRVSQEPLAIDALTAISETCAAVARLTDDQQVPRHDANGAGLLVLTAVVRPASA
jgi:uncharacterized caspase-like protein